MAGTFCALFGSSLANFFLRNGDIQKLLSHDLIWIDETGYAEIQKRFPYTWLGKFFSIGNYARQARILGKCLLYRDPWGCSHAGRGVLWEHGPLCHGDPAVQFFNKTWAYRMSDRHVERYFLWRIGDLAYYICAGLADDDFGYDRINWQQNCDDGEPGMDKCWSPIDGKPGWRDGGNWNIGRMREIEYQLAAECERQRKVYAINGSKATHPHTMRIWEGYGPDGDARYWNSESQVMRDAKPGDAVILRVLDVHGQIYDDVLADVPRLIEQTRLRGLRVGLSYREFNQMRGSRMSYWEAVSQWPQAAQEAMA